MIIESPRTIIIAEAGVNHNGDISIAKKLIEVAANSGADYVKFQTFSATELASEIAATAEYQDKNTGSSGKQVDMLQKLQLSLQDHIELMKVCEANKIKFLSTAFDFQSIELLRNLKIALWKIPSGEITNLPYLKRIGSFGNPVILSSGMSTLGEIEAALRILEESGTHRDLITILHCTTEYPAPINEVNLNAMNTIRNAFGTKVGYSDHTNGIEVSLAAVALGANVIEKHFTLDRSLPGPDHKASLEPIELDSLVSGIRKIEKSLGNGIKRPVASEIKNIPIARKSIVAKRKIKIGEMFTEDNLTVKRPGTGISPMRWMEVIGQVASKDYQVDDFI